jgi:predicted phosphoribosyltransferase
MFRDRTDAGEQLGTRLREEGVVADLVLAIPRGGLPLGRAVADALDAPLDVVVARKMGAPTNEELAIGAVASDGTAWLNEDLITSLDVGEDYVAAERERQATAAREKRDRYRGESAPPVEGRRVVLVDDGVATGATTRACLRQLRDLGASHVTLAVPVAPPDVIDELRAEADDVLALSTPASFRAVGAHYERFDQVSDDEAMTYLAPD